MTALSKHGFIREDMRLRHSCEYRLQLKRDLQSTLASIENCIWSESFELRWSESEEERKHSISQLKEFMRIRRELILELEVA